MGARKLSFRLLLALISAVVVLLAACSLATPTPGTPPPTPAYMACEHYKSFDAAKKVWLEKYKNLELNGYAVNVNNLWDENGEWIEGVYGIVERRNTGLLLGRIPDADLLRREATRLRCLDGVPVQTVFDSLFLGLVPGQPEKVADPTPRTCQHVHNTGVCEEQYGGAQQRDIEEVRVPHRKLSQRRLLCCIRVLVCV